MEPSLYKSKGLLFWIRAARLRTLPLSVSGILAGSGWGVTQGVFQWPIFFSALLTTIFFQVLSNFANDYGDGVKGTDQQGRLGPERLLQHSDAAKSTLKWVLVAFAVLSIASAALTLYLSFGWERQYWLIFMGLTAASIAAAIGYTVGKHAYGYLGLGDIFVFVFFGMLGVWGSAFLYTKIWDPYSLWPLVWVIGMGSVGVLNLNNMRDAQSDALSGKKTLAVRLGPRYMLWYHSFLIISIGLVTLYWVGVQFQNWTLFSLFIPLFFYGKHLKKVWRERTPKSWDGELKTVALSTFFWSLGWFLWSFTAHF